MTSSSSSILVVVFMTTDLKIAETFCYTSSKNYKITNPKLKPKMPRFWGKSQSGETDMNKQHMHVCHAPSCILLKSVSDFMQLTLIMSSERSDKVGNA